MPFRCRSNPNGFRRSRSATRRCGRPSGCAAQYGAPRLWLKDDTCNPSGSFKDRASYLVAAFARKHGVKEIVLASTGNAASSMAAVGAAAGLPVKVFLPAAAPVAKRIQVLQYGAELVSVDGTYDQAFDLSLAYSNETGSLSRNTAYNPLTIEGKKTVAFEIVHDLLQADAGAPGHIFVPVGDGVILAGVYRGFENLLKLGRIAKMPVVWACQAEGSSAIARAWASPADASDPFGAPRPSVTVADSIAVDVPRNGLHALEQAQALRWPGCYGIGRRDSCRAANARIRIGPVCRALVERRVRGLAQGARSPAGRRERRGADHRLRFEETSNPRHKALD